MGARLEVHKPDLAYDNQGWAMASDSRACDMYPPESISAETFTHSQFTLVYPVAVGITFK